MSTKLKNFHLRNTTLTKEEKEELIDYCSSLGYVLDTEPKEFNGEMPIIRKSLTDNRKGYVQRIKGVLWWVYSQKRENLSEAIELHKKLEANNVSGQKRLMRLLTGIIDFEFANDYRHD